MKKFIAITLLSLVSSVSMAATITTPANLTIQAVDGQKQYDATRLEVTQGQHLIELQVYADFSSGADESNIVKSKPLYLSVTVDNDDVMDITTAALLSADDAKNFINNPSVTINGNKTLKLYSHEQLMALILDEHHMMKAKD